MCLQQAFLHPLVPMFMFNFSDISFWSFFLPTVERLCRSAAAPIARWFFQWVKRLRWIVYVNSVLTSLNLMLLCVIGLPGLPTKNKAHELFL